MQDPKTFAAHVAQAIETGRPAAGQPGARKRVHAAENRRFQMGRGRERDADLTQAGGQAAADFLEHGLLGHPQVEECGGVAREQRLLVRGKPAGS